MKAREKTFALDGFKVVRLFGSLDREIRVETK